MCGPPSSSRPSPSPVLSPQLRWSHVAMDVVLPSFLIVGLPYWLCAARANSCLSLLGICDGWNRLGLQLTVSPRTILSINVTVASFTISLSRPSIKNISPSYLMDLDAMSSSSNPNSLILAKKSVIWLVPSLGFRWQPIISSSVTCCPWLWASKLLVPSADLTGLIPVIIDKTPACGSHHSV